MYLICVYARCTNLKECCAAIRSKRDRDTPLEKRCVVHIGSQC